MKNNLCLALAWLFLPYLPTTSAQTALPGAGTNFWFGWLLNHDLDASDRFLAHIYGPEGATGTLDATGIGFSKHFTIGGEGFVAIELPSGVENLTSNAIAKKGVHLQTDSLVRVEIFSREALSSDGSMVLPVSALGQEYLISSYPGADGGRTALLVVATANDTRVEIVPTSFSWGGVAAGSTVVVDLDAGQSYQLYGVADYTGTRIRVTGSNAGEKPVAVFSGSTCANVPVGCKACDYLMTQERPVSAWRKAFILTPLRGQGYTYRVLAASNGTQLINAAVDTVVLNRGEFYEENQLTAPRYLTASKPVSVTQFMEGWNCAASSAGFRGDPAATLLFGKDEFCQQTALHTAPLGDTTRYFVNVLTESAHIDQFSLDGAPVPPGLFQPVPPAPEYSFARLELTPGGHRLESPAGFSGVAYGASLAESYLLHLGSLTAPALSAAQDRPPARPLLTLSPNPFGASLNVYWDAASGTPDLAVFNALGQQVHPLLVPGAGGCQLFLEGYPVGTYFVQALFGGKRVVEKVVKIGG